MELEVFWLDRGHTWLAHRHSYAIPSFGRVAPLMSHYWSGKLCVRLAHFPPS